MTETYDLIGDIHGQFAALETMLSQLGYACDPAGNWSHPEENHLVFLGDLIDRGAKNREVVTTVRSLVDQGIATCLMGNHEFNAVQYYSQHPEKSGTYLRKHSEKNQAQHQAFIDSYADYADELPEVIDWFSKLPVAIETPYFRAVHACWSPSHLKNLIQKEHAWLMPPTPWVDATDKTHILYETVGVLLKGPEAILPNGISFEDRGGIQRTSVRLAWWKATPTNWAAAVDPSENIKNLETIPWKQTSPFSYATNDIPVFFGHYWRSGTPALDADNALCLDYSAGKGGHLTSYRFHIKHDDLHPNQMMQVRA